MKKYLFFFLIISTITFAQPNAWINEFHYDNVGTPDVGEFVEVAIENYTDFDLSVIRISFYTASGDRTGSYHTLDGFTIGATENNITLFYKLISGIQNGPNDGIALAYEKEAFQFISYEGVVTALDGDAENTTSENISVSQNNSTPVGGSLGLEGSGTNYSDFNWQIFATATPGQPNSTQVLPVELTTFTASLSEQSVELIWKTATEVNNYGFDIERKIKEGDWSKLSFVNGHGNSNSPKFYSFVDNSVEESGNYYYRLKQIDIDGTYEYSEIVEANLGAPNKFELNQNFPNPFNPYTSIQFNLPYDNQIKLTVFNILGEEVAELLNTKITAGYHSIQFDGAELNSGIYFYKLESKDFTQIRKMMLIK